MILCPGILSVSWKKDKGLRLHVSPCFIWWPLLDLNQRPSDYESPALTTELRGRGGEL